MASLLARSAAAFCSPAAAMARVPRAPQHCFASASAGLAISEEDRFLFDLEGYLVIPGVFSPEEISAANAAVDAHATEIKERKGALRNTKSGTPLQGDGKTGRQDMGGMLGWPSPMSDVFRKLLAHPKLVPYFHTFLGDGYRMDHLPLFISQRPGSEGFALHGGPLTEAGDPNFFLTYDVKKDIIRNSLLGVTLQLTDVKENAGGFCVLRGSHKANFNVPQSLVHGEAYADRLYQPTTKAGDVVIFSEATSHGTLPWRADYERRAVIYRFAPANMAYSRSYNPSWGEETLEGLNEQQEAVLQPPYNSRLDRPQLVENGEGGFDVKNVSRTDFKKAFDKEVFKTEYF